MTNREESEVTDDLYNLSAFDFSRPWGFSLPIKDKQFVEWDAVETALGALNVAHGPIVSLPAGQDPPDCWALVGGQRVGFEVTELMHQYAFKESKAANRVGIPERGCWCFWAKEPFLAKLTEIVETKSKKLASVKSKCEYASLWLVVHAGEPSLAKFYVDEFLDRFTAKTDVFDKLLFVIAYQPGQGYPTWDVPTV
jgi:hypothetical protein